MNFPNKNDINQHKNQIYKQQLRMIAVSFTLYIDC